MRLQDHRHPVFGWVPVFRCSIKMALPTKMALFMDRLSDRPIHENHHSHGQAPAWSLRSSHKRQRRHADADLRREDGPQSLEAGMKGAAGSEDIVDQQKMSDSAFFHQGC